MLLCYAWIVGLSTGKPKWLKYGYSFAFSYQCDLLSLIFNPTAPANGPALQKLYGAVFYEMFLAVGSEWCHCGYWCC